MPPQPSRCRCRRCASTTGRSQAAWGSSYGRESNYLRVYASQIRRKLEPDPGRPVHVLTEPGVGYRLVR
ncbi:MULTISPECIES: winged helix-turn-helix domain-containing protein [Arsenicicoccus]|uniref:winged helix-turn-helix domain-containing protein n=1 Tax=Arsenicicoccus sp. UBA2120 TaxID=1946055 RepID=UPI0035E43D03